MRSSIVFYLNGKRHSVGGEHASMMLSEYLRYDQCLTGTKIVCAEGDCGACSVLRYYPANKDSVEGQNYYPINSCITPVATLDGSSILTIEALEKDNELHETQRSMVENHGSQCGFCTPGFVMSLAGLVEKKLCRNEKKISEQEAKNAMTGNLCRCTGYDSIIDSAKDIDLDKCESVKERYFNDDQEHDLLNVSSTPVFIESDHYTFSAPISVQSAIDCLIKHPKTKIIASSTDLGVIRNKRKTKLNHLLSLHLVKELYQVSEQDNTITLGARVTLTELRHFLKNRLPALSEYIDVFASPQIKNIATVVGNIANASPIGDMPPALLALHAKIHLYSRAGERIIPLESFFLDYRKTALQPEELITGVSFDLPGKDFFKSFKNSNRKDLDISTVNFSMYISKDEKTYRIAAGGIAAVPLRLKKTEEYLQKNDLNSKTVHEAIDILHTEFTPLTDVRGSAAYRHMLVENYFKRSISQFMEGRS